MFPRCQETKEDKVKSESLEEKKYLKTSHSLSYIYNIPTTVNWSYLNHKICSYTPIVALHTYNFSVIRSPQWVNAYFCNFVKRNDQKLPGSMYAGGLLVNADITSPIVSLQCRHESHRLYCEIIIVQICS